MRFVQYKNHYFYGMSPQFTKTNVCVRACVCVLCTVADWHFFFFFKCSNIGSLNSFVCVCVSDWFLFDKIKKEKQNPLCYSLIQWFSIQCFCGCACLWACVCRSVSVCHTENVVGSPLPLCVCMICVVLDLLIFIGQIRKNCSEL